MDYKKLLADTVIIEGIDNEEIMSQIVPFRDKENGDE